MVSARPRTDGPDVEPETCERRQVILEVRKQTIREGSQKKKCKQRYPTPKCVSLLRIDHIGGVVLIIFNRPHLDGFVK